MLRLLIDENLNHRILRGLRFIVPDLDCIIAQRAGLKGVSDPQLLASCAEQALILVTHDVNTVPKHAFERGSLFLFGGNDAFGTALGDTWLWDGTNWQQGPLNFTDDFESPVLNPFWTNYANAGFVVFPSTNLPHGGAQSVALSSVANAGQKSIGVYHDFASPIYGRASIWMYDSGADELSGNSIGAAVKIGRAHV